MADGSNIQSQNVYCRKLYLVGRVARGEDYEGHPQQDQQPQEQQSALHATLLS